MSKKRKSYAWKDPSLLTRVVLVVLCLSMLLILASLATDIGFGTAADYGTLAGQMTGAQLLRWLVDVLRLAVLLACITVLFWIVRASKNAHSFKPNMKMSPLGAIGWYLVPVAGWFKPFEAMSEIWQVSSTQTDRRGDWLLNCWWGAFIVNNVVAAPVAFMGRQDAALVLPFKVASDAAGLVVTVLLFLLVRRVTAMQLEKRQAWMFEGEPEPRSATLLEGLAG